MAKQAGIPKGVLQIVTGKSSVVASTDKDSQKAVYGAWW
ncbi:hypothetical protein AO380_0645 [Moraxella catarrhalis]|nr:hypothetical protein AO380_0645 [Moraxella catarrhalis]